MGAGDGELTIAAARTVGATGRVYASELGDERVKGLRDKVAQSNLEQITVVAGDARRTNFPDGACDAVFMRNVYHHFADPPAMNASIAAALKPGGILAVVDFTPPPGGEATCPADRGKDGMHGVTLEALSRELKEAGFELISSNARQRSIMVVVSKPKP
jgi:ubiquinone/menaquinone biosynthesis C-methylase UbiE